MRIAGFRPTVVMAVVRVDSLEMRGLCFLRPERLRRSRYARHGSHGW